MITAPLPLPHWLEPVIALPHIVLGGPVAHLIADMPAAPHPALLAIYAPLLLARSDRIRRFVGNIFRGIADNLNWKKLMSAKLDSLVAAVADLETAIATNSKDISDAAQLFKDNAAASVQLAADEAIIDGLTARVNGAVNALRADAGALDAAKADAANTVNATQAPADPVAAPAS